MQTGTGSKAIAIYVAIAVIFLVGGGIIGFFWGQGRAAARYEPLVNAAFPPPPAVINTLSGTVKSVYGANVTLTVQDPNDYLPHLDGSPRKTEDVTAKTFSGTKMEMIDYARLNSANQPTVTQISATDLKPGDQVTVKSQENLRNATTFDASEVILSRY